MVFTSLKVHSVHLGTIAYSTEDVHLVIKALCNLLPPSLRSEAQSKVKKQRITGHFGNKIYRITYTVKKKNTMTVCHYILREKINKMAQSFISRSMEKLYDSKNQEFFIRVSKGRLVSDEITIASGSESPIRVVIKFQQYGGSRSERTKRAWKFILSEMSSGEGSPET
ncbi:MAG: RNA-binding domain-containing protein [Candidatus Hodarchaeota archaeon]